MLLKLIFLLSCAASAGVCLLGGCFQTFRWLWVLPVSFAGFFLVLAALCVAVVWALCQRIDPDQPMEEDSPFYRKLASLCIEALVQILQVRIHATGLEKVPKDGRFLLVCNHIFAADPGILLHALPNSQLAFISKQENRKLFVVGRIMHAMLCQTIDRDNDRAALKTILECIRLVKEDKASIGVFPEGGTNSDNRLHPFRPGAFKIAQKCHIPIVVCTLQGTRDILKNGLKLKHTDVRLHLLTVLSPEEFEGMKTTEISDRVFEIMKNDLDEEFKPLES
jgi:1-acyl-sn-glycerol-3-phosphate acyltransferase